MQFDRHSGRTRSALSVILAKIPAVAATLLCATIQPGASFAQATKTGAGPTYSKEVRAILNARCVVCHSKSTVSNTALSGGLALDTLAAIKIGAGPGALVTPGKSADSELFKRLTASSASKLMPKGGPALPAAQIAIIKKWIDAGAHAGNAPKDPELKTVSAEAAPMPLNRQVLDVDLPVKVEVPADLRSKNSPPNSPLLFALKVGPLPPVTALAYSPDGKMLAVGSYRAFMVWDTITGQAIMCRTHLPGAVLSLAFRPDGAQIAVAGGTPGSSGDVRIYDTKTWTPAGSPLTGHTDSVVSVVWNSDGTRLATGSQDKTARIWEWPSGKEKLVFKDHSDAVTRVCFSPDGKSLYTASLDHNARRFDAEKGGVLKQFTGHNEAVMALAVSPNGKSIVTSGVEPNLRWWNVETGETTNNNGNHSGPVNEIVFSKDGTMVASASADKLVRLWDGANTGHRRALEGAGDWVYTCAISPDNKFVAGAGAEGIVRIWEAPTGRQRLSLLFWPPAEKAGALQWLSLSPEGFFDGSPEWTARLRLLVNGKPITSPRLADFVKTLKQSEVISKVWQGAALETAKIPAGK